MGHDRINVPILTDEAERDNPDMIHGEGRASPGKRVPEPYIL